jgi:hypothetical protein
MNNCLAKWVVPCLAPLFRLLGGVYQGVAWQWTPSSDSTIVAFRRHVTILIPYITHLNKFVHSVVAYIQILILYKNDVNNKTRVAIGAP